MNAVLPQSQALIGTCRRFGEYGPVYEITGIASHNASGEQMVRIHVFDSGEDADYKLADAIDDPAAD